MNINRFKKFISVFIVVILLLAFLLPEFDCVMYYAATVVSETTRKKTVGHKIEGAEYYDEMWEKFRVIAVDNGGGNGEGGGAGGDEALNAGNSGTGNEAGGTFGSAAGVGIGRGVQQNVGGEGGSTTGIGTGSGNNAGSGANGQNGNQGTSNRFSTMPGSSGSDVADAYRALRQEIDESRAESLQRVLETAINQSIVAASIAERESIQASIQKKLAQESIKAKIMPQETQRTYDMIPDKSIYVPTTRRQVETDVATQAPTTMRQFETYIETLVPTSVSSNPNIYDFVPQTTQHEVFAVEMFKAMQDVPKNTTQAITAPTGEYRERPTIAPPETTFMTSEFEPGDFIETTVRNDIVMPSLDVREETLSPTKEVTEAAETTGTSEAIKEGEEKQGESGAVNEENESETAESANNDDEGAGSKGGADAEADQDKEGDDGADEDAGAASEEGLFHLDTKGEHAGKKVFELDENGNIGLNPEHLSVTSTKTVMLLASILLFIIGVITYFMRIRDKKNKHNYF